MSGIYGMFHRDGAPVSPVDLQTMRTAMSHWGRDGKGLWQAGSVALGQMRTFATPEDTYDNVPYLLDGIAFTAAGRVDNRAALLADCRQQLDAFRPNATQSLIADSDILFAAYRKWGCDAPKRIYGDWAFAAWNPRERELFLARDHFGNTALYYSIDAHRFAFASERKALLALGLAPMEMDELYLAQVLITWPAYHGERTIHKPIKRLPPAHTLTVTQDDCKAQQYWHLEQTPELHLPKREDYVQAFLEVFDEAVRCRLRTYSPPQETDERRAQGHVGVALSGGLDSSSVAVTAARISQERNLRIGAFTSIPLYDTTPYVGAWFGDEQPYTQSVARYAGNIDLYAVPAAGITPVQAVRRWLPVFNEPLHGPSNFYWLLDLMETACAQGYRTLLTGQSGNAGISWTGDPASHPLHTQIRLSRRRNWGSKTIKQRIKASLRQHAPARMLELYHHLRPQDPTKSPYALTAIHPDFANRLKLYQRQRDDQNTQPPQSPRASRVNILLPGSSFVGAIWAETGAFSGLDIRDPTADARVLEFTLSVPDRIYIDPRSLQDRWLIREAMRGRLPDDVRLNQRRGRQSGDLVPRLRASAGEVEAALSELEQGPAMAYLDVAHMRTAWNEVQRDDTLAAFHKAITILTRGLMAGLWINGFEAGKW